MTPDWQLPPGVDRGLWDYLRSAEMVAGYDAMMAASPLATQDVQFCERHFPTPGSLIDLGCGTGRLAKHFAAKGYDCTGVDLSDEMLAVARQDDRVRWVNANLLELNLKERFDYAACLFSTLGMVRGDRGQVLANIRRVLKPGGTFVLHVHNRWYRPLGWRRWINGDITMPQAYGGAQLTIHHFTRREISRLLATAGFNRTAVEPITSTDGVYGYLLASR